MLLSTASFALMNLCVKKLSHIPPMELVFFRCFISMSICMGILYRAGIDWRGSQRVRLIARGVAGTVAVYTFFVTMQAMPLATAVTIQYTSPIFTTIIAALVLGERVRLLQYGFFMLSFIGVILIKGLDTSVSMTYLGIGLASALSSGIAYNLVRSLRGQEHPIVVVLHFQLVGTVVGAACTLVQWQMPQGIDWLYIGLVGICTQLGQTYLTRALQSERVAITSSLNYLGVLYALIFGWMFLQESYRATTLVGIVLVVGGVLLNLVYAPAPEPIVIAGITDADE
jgi:drug/metabolite transporter (DMT)-like permease